MHKAFFRITAFAALMLVLSGPSALACSVFTSADWNQAYFCSNEDFDNGNTYAWFLPAGKGTFGVALFGYDDACVQGGMNDKGLALDWAGTEPQQMIYYPDRVNPEGDRNRLYFCTLSETILKTCSTLGDVVSLLGKYNESAFSYAHLMVADNSGASAIFEWHDKKFEVIRKSASYQEMTNVNTTAASANGFAYTADNENYSYMRYYAIKRVLDNAGTVSLDASLSALRAASDYKTQYSYICDLKNGVIVMYDKRNFAKGFRIVLADELKKGAHILTTGMGEFSVDPKYRQVGINNQNPLALGRGKAETLIACAAALVFAVLSILLIRRRRIYILPAVADLMVLPMVWALMRYGYFLRYGFTFGQKVLLALPILFIALTAAQVVCTAVQLLRRKGRVYIPLAVNAALSAFLAVVLSINVLF